MCADINEPVMPKTLNPSFFRREYHAEIVIQRSVEQYIKQLGPSSSGRTVLDFGADVLPYKPLFDQAQIKLVGADIPPVKNPETLAIDTATGRVPVADNTFDGLISTQVLEHVPDDDGYLREALRVLKPGAPGLITTHGTFVLHRHPTDMRRWTVDGLRYDLEHAGFIVDRVEPRIGILASCTHFRTITFNSFLRRRPVLRHLRPLLNLWCNTQMLIEDAILPTAFLEKLPELVIATVRKP